MALGPKLQRYLQHMPAVALTVTALLVVMLGLPFAPRLKGFVFGFGVFALDVAIMVKIFADIVLTPGARSMGKAGLSAMAVLKLVIVGGGLFMGIVVARLPGASVFGGALVALVLSCVFLIALDRKWRGSAKKS